MKRFIEITNKPNLLKSPNILRSKVLKGMKQGMLKAEATTKKSFGKPGMLGVITGNLRRSINSRVYTSNDTIIGAIGTNVSYGRTHELGKKPFLKPALEVENEFIINKIKEYITKK